MNYEVKEQMYEGKAKQVFATSDPEIVMVHYKDDATAGDGEKKGTIRDKGIVNNKLSNALMQKLEKEGIPTHYVQEINDRDTFVKKVEIVPLEVIIRNVAAGHFTLRMGVPEGTEFKTPILEFSYKNDDLHDPFINHYYALALGLATQEEIDTITKYAFKINEDHAGCQHPPDRLQGRVRPPVRRHHHPGRRDQPRHLPFLGCHHRRTSGQGPVPPQPGRRG